MKKVTNIIGYIASFCMLIGLLFKMQHWPGSFPVALASTFIFCLLFLPLFIFSLLRNKNFEKVFSIIAAALISMFALGLNFKIMHLPGAAPFVIVSMFFSGIFLVPYMLFTLRKKAQTGKEKKAILFGSIGLSLLILGLLFKIQHWPGAGPGLILGTVFLAFVFLPFYISSNIKTIKAKILNLPILLYFSSLIVILFFFNVSRTLLNSFVLVEEGLNESGKYLGEKTYSFYSKFEKHNSEQTKIYLQKAMKVKELSDDLYGHIEKLKAHLIRNTDGIPNEISDDSLTLAKTAGKDNYDVPTHIMIGEPAAPKGGAWTGVELKAKIFVFRQDIISMFEGEKKEIMEKTLGLRTDDFGYNFAGDYETWEVGYFYHTPLAGVITMLSKLQSDVRYAESVTVEYLYNEAEKKAADGSGALQ